MAFRGVELVALAELGYASRSVVGEWPDSGVTFETVRGSFEISRDALARAEATGDDYEIRRAFAVNLPHGSQAYRRAKGDAGALVVFWRLILIVEA